MHRGDPQFVAPLDSTVASYIDPRRNPFFSEAEIEHFVATDGTGRFLGRISTTIEWRYVDKFGPCGWFGWFDCVNDEQVADALLGAAENWVRGRGMSRIEGPFSYDPTQEFGQLTHGFETAPALLQPHHDPYYVDLLRACGYEPRYGTSTYTWTPADAGPLQRVSDRARRVLDKGGLTARCLDQHHRARDIELLWDLFLDTFSDQHDMLPMSRAVFDWQYKEMAQFIDHRLIHIVERDGKPIGFNFLIADANEVLRHADGRARPLFLARYPFLRRNVTGAVVLMVGVKKGEEHTGAGRVLAGHMADVALGKVGRYRALHTTWVHDENVSSHALINFTGAEPRRRYAVLGKAL